MGVLLSIMVMARNCTNTFRIGFLLIDGFALMSYSSAEEPVRAANLLNPDAYQITHLCIGNSGAVSSSGAMVPAISIDKAHESFDLILVVAGSDPFKLTAPLLHKWLRWQAHHGVLIGGVSGGPVVLCMAGLMQGYRMTLHWEHAQALSEEYPELLIERSLYVIDRNRLTCAGGTAPLDMMHALITQHHGADFARQVSDWFSHTTVRVSSEPQRAGLAERYRTHDQSILAVIETMENHVAEPLELTQLAKIVGLGARQLNRLFKHKLGTSTIAFYRNLRLDIAENLLLQSQLSITDIAMASGFVSAAHFSSTFKSRYGVAPSVLRSRSLNKNKMVTT